LRAFDEPQNAGNFTGIDEEKSGGRIKRRSTELKHRCSVKKKKGYEINEKDEIN